MRYMYSIFKVIALHLKALHSSILLEASKKKGVVNMCFTGILILRVHIAVLQCT